MKNSIILTLVLFALILSGCADVSHVEECLPATEHTYGFWGGVWHGMISTFAWIGSLFYDDIAIYAVNNNGGWYDFGYIGGLGILVSAFKLVIKLIITIIE